MGYTLSIASGIGIGAALSILAIILALHWIYGVPVTINSLL